MIKTREIYYRLNIVQTIPTEIFYIAQTRLYLILVIKTYFAWFKYVINKHFYRIYYKPSGRLVNNNHVYTTLYILYLYIYYILLWP